MICLTFRQVLCFAAGHFISERWVLASVERLDPRIFQPPCTAQNCNVPYPPGSEDAAISPGGTEETCRPSRALGCAPNIPGVRKTRCPVTSLFASLRLVHHLAKGRGGAHKTKPRSGEQTVDGGERFSRTPGWASAGISPGGAKEKGDEILSKNHKICRPFRAFRCHPYDPGVRKKRSPPATVFRPSGPSLQLAHFRPQENRQLQTVQTSTAGGRAHSRLFSCRRSTAPTDNSQNSSFKELVAAHRTAPMHRDHAMGK